MSNKMTGIDSGEQKVKVLVQFIQDRSGSMGTVWAEALSGYKTFIDGLKNGRDDNVEYMFSLTTFDTLIDIPVKPQPIANVTGEELKAYGPRGCTALYDAVGKTLAETAAQADKYIVVIVTDGQENSSREWTKEALHAAIDAKIKLGNWTFTYLGTQPETWDDATSIGVGVGATVTYDPTRGHDTYAYMANTIRSFGASGQSMSANLMTDTSFNSAEAQARIGMVAKGITLTTPSQPSKTPKKSSKMWR